MHGRYRLSRVGRRGGIAPFTSVLWALVPLLTVGWATGFSFTYAAIRLRNWALGVVAGVYFALGMVSFILVGSSTSTSDWRLNVGTALAVFLMVLGTAHAFGIRRRLTGQPELNPSGFGGQQAQAIAEAKAELRRRSEARHLVRTDPPLARQLGIGRPDLLRRFNDGGLVDANHAPAPSLAALPGIDSSLADQIVAARDVVGGFKGLADLSIILGIAPQRLDEAGEFLVFPLYAAPDRSRSAG